MERRGGMETILCTTPLGRKRTVRAKLAVSAGVAVLIAAASCLPHLIQVLRDYGLPVLFAPAMSISEFESLPAFVTLSDVLLFWFVCRIAACLCMGAITLTLGRVFGNLLPALFVQRRGVLPARAVEPLGYGWRHRVAGVLAAVPCGELLHDPGVRR